MQPRDWLAELEAQENEAQVARRSSKVEADLEQIKKLVSALPHITHATIPSLPQPLCFGRRRFRIPSPDPCSRTPS